MHSFLPKYHEYVVEQHAYTLLPHYLGTATARTRTRTRSRTRSTPPAPAPAPRSPNQTILCPVSQSHSQTASHSPLSTVSICARRHVPRSRQRPEALPARHAPHVLAAPARARQVRPQGARLPLHCFAFLSRLPRPPLGPLIPHAYDSNSPSHSHSQPHPQSTRTLTRSSTLRGAPAAAARVERFRPVFSACFVRSPRTRES